jgi:hypothetical protein
MLVLGATYYCAITSTNICLIAISVRNHGMIPFAHGIFGIGALISPQIVRIL